MPPGWVGLAPCTLHVEHGRTGGKSEIRNLYCQVLTKSCPRSGAAERRQIHSLGREPQDTNEKILRKPRSGDRNIAVIPAAHGTTDVCRPLRGLRVYLSSFPWGSRPRLRKCRASGAQIRASLRRVFMKVVRRVPNYFRTRQVGGTCILHLVSR